MRYASLNVWRLDGECRIWVFRDSRIALEHLCDHVLTLPEGRVWFLLLDSLGRIVRLEETALVNYARQLWSNTAPSNAQGLFEAYGEKIEAGLTEARWRGWTWQDSHHRWRGVNCYGVYVMWDDWAVLTGMIVALAAKQPTIRPTLEERATNPLPRMNTRPWPSRIPELPSSDPVPSPACIDKVLYHCFVEGMARLRQEHDWAQDDGSVESPLPREVYARMPFQQWQAICLASGSTQRQGLEK